MKDKIEFNILIISQDLKKLAKEKMDENKTFGEVAEMHVEIQKLNHTLLTLKNLLK